MSAWLGRNCRSDAGAGSRTGRRELGFDAPTANSMDATSDRDFALEFAQALSMLGSASQPLGGGVHPLRHPGVWLRASAGSYSTGSSAMPQKQNPDALELIRGKSARLIGSQVALLITLKGLPLAYNKDMQETQEPVFDVAETASAIAWGLRRDSCARCSSISSACRRPAKRGFMNAMAAATYLAGHGVPFRQAHEIVAQAVQPCAGAGLRTARQLALDELREFSPAFGDDFYAAFNAGGRAGLP